MRQQNRVIFDRKGLGGRRQFRVINPLFELGTRTSDVPSTPDSVDDNAWNNSETRLFSAPVKTVILCHFSPSDRSQHAVRFSDFLPEAASVLFRGLRIEWLIDSARRARP